MNNKNYFEQTFDDRKKAEKISLKADLIFLIFLMDVKREFSLTASRQ